MADEVNAEAERAANAARAAVKRANNPSSSSLLPLALVVFAVLTAAALLLMDSDGQPQTQPRVEGPTITQPNK